MGAAATMLLPGFGMHDPFLPIIYLVCGICLDGFFRVAGENAQKIFVIALITGVCWMIIPLLRSVVVVFSGVPEMSFRHGMAWPVLSHFIFGVLGGIFGFSIVKIGESLGKKKASTTPNSFS